MYNKLSKVSGYPEYLELTLGKLTKVLAEINHCLVLVNADTPCITSAILRRLNDNNIAFYVPSFSEIEHMGGIGNYLRKQLEANQEHDEDILILNCQDINVAVPYTVHDFVDAVNSNRDLFTTVFKSVVIISPPPLTYAIQKHAYDFWSCVEWYINTVSWYDSPYTVPIIHMHVYELNRSSLLLNLSSKNRELYVKFLNFRDKLSGTAMYTPGWFADTLSEINGFEGECYYDLILHFISVATHIPSGRYMFRQQKQDLLKLEIKLDIPLVSAEAYIMIAEFFYNCGDYAVAKEYFKYAHKYLVNAAEKPKNSYILAFLDCNNFVCGLLAAKNNEVEVYDLSKELSLRLQGLPSGCKDFIDNYLFLAEYAFKCTSYSSHKDALTRLSSMTVTSLPGASISQNVKYALLWETNYMHTNFSYTVDNSRFSIGRLIEYIWVALRNFREGNYTDAKNIIKHTKCQAQRYGYLEASKLLDNIKKNMAYLQKQNDTFSPFKHH